MFAKDVAVQVMFLIAAVYFSVGMILNYCTFITEVVFEKERELMYITVIQYIMMLFIAINIVFILINTKYNFKFRNLRIAADIDNKVVFYLLCLPTLQFAIVTLVILTMKGWLDKLLLGYNQSIYCLFVAFEFICLLLLLLDTSGFTDTGENWRLNYWNCLTILITIVSIIMQVIFNIILAQASNFDHALRNVYNISLVHETKSIYFNRLISKFLPYKKVAIISLLTTFIPFLFIAFNRNFVNLRNNNDEIQLSNSFDETFRTSTQNEPEPRHCITVTSVIFPFLHMACGIYFIYLFFSQPLDDFKHENSIFLSITQILKILIFILLLRDISKWKLSNANDPFRNFCLIFINIGVCAQYLITLSFIFIDFTHYFLNIITNIRALLFYGTQSILNFGTTTLMCLVLVTSLKRKPEAYRPRTLGYFIQPPFCLMLISLTEFILELVNFSLRDYPNFEFQTAVMVKSINSIGRPFQLMFKWLSFILFLRMLSIMTKNRRFISL